MESYFLLSISSHTRPTLARALRFSSADDGIKFGTALIARFE